MRNVNIVVASAVAAFAFAFLAPTSSAQAGACGATNKEVTLGCNKKITLKTSEYTKVSGGKAFVQEVGQPNGCLVAIKVRKTRSDDKMYGKAITTPYFALAASGIERKGGKWADISKGGKSNMRGYEAFSGACNGSRYSEILPRP